MEESAVYPLSLRLAGRRVVVVGGGSVALRRVSGLRAAGADVLLIAPELSPSLADLADRGLIAAHRRAYAPGDLEGAWLAHACTDRPEVNAAVAAEAERLRIWCVRADDAAASAAWTPAVGRAAGVTVALTAGGDPRRAAVLRDRCVDLVVAAPATAAGRDAAAGGGRVVIVGGGPGDPGLLTVAGLRALREADVVVADRLAPQRVLDELAPGVEVVDAAKVPGGPAMRQEHINRALVEHARAGRMVVRLKGGDPFVFGRGREEVEACRAAGVPVTVVPGVTSAISVPAAAGIPVTHRGLSQGFTVISGHASPADPACALDWAALARSRTTLVLLMAVENLPGIAGALMTAGLAEGTPAACVSDGWAPGQRVVAAPLGQLAEAVRDAGVVNPAVVVIGEVARYAETPGGPAPERADERRPGRRVLVLGGARSGKSATAEGMLAGHEAVCYLATGPLPGDGDAEWDERVRDHRRRRPGAWQTTETLDLEAALVSPDIRMPVLVDCLSTWLARVMDECGAFSGEPAGRAKLAERVAGLAAAWRSTRHQVVAVSNEVGSGVVPGTASGRLFRDELGRLNARLAADSDEVWLCTAGIARRLR